MAVLTDDTVAEVLSMGTSINSLIVYALLLGIIIACVIIVCVLLIKLKSKRDVSIGNSKKMGTESTIGGFCTHCGNKQKPGAVFCSYCGEKIATQDLTMSMTNAQTGTFHKQKSKVVLVFALGITAIVIIAFFAFQWGGEVFMRDPHGLNGYWEIANIRNNNSPVYVFNGNRFTHYTVYMEFLVDSYITQSDLSNGNYTRFLHGGSSFGGIPILTRQASYRQPQRGTTFELIEIREAGEVRTWVPGRAGWSHPASFDNDTVSVVAYHVRMREINEGTFSLSDSGDRIEFIWPSGAIRVHRFQRTENTIDLDGVRFVRR